MATPPSARKTTPCVLDLFAGPGGWDEGVRGLGIAPRGIELNSAACDTARAAGHYRHQADVAALNPQDSVLPWGPCRGLIASPPCQGFSAAGKGHGRADAALLLQAIPAMLRRDVRPELHDRMTDDRSVLVLEPLRWALALTPSWLAWEQVPAVLPIWEACADVLRSIGYSVATGVLNAEQHGVPQTRRRAALVARAPWLTRTLGPAALPTPTHSRYYSHDPLRLDPGVPQWVSMAQVLDLPAGTVHTGQNSRQAAGTTVRYRRDVDLPAPTVTGQTRSWRLRSNYGTGGNASARGERTLDQPAPTVTSKVGRNKWVPIDANAGDIGLGSERVTVQQAARLQTFPADYPWQGTKTAQYQQVGDAVPPLLARAIVVSVAAVGVVDTEAAA